MEIRKINADLLAKMFIQGTLNLDKDKELINELNVFPVPDGDTGTNMNLTMQSAIANLKNNMDSTVYGVAKAISKGSLMGARGNSGVILSQIFRGFYKGLEEKEDLSIVDFATALKSASDMAYKAVLKPVEGTMLTVIKETAEKAMKVATEDMAMHDFFKIIIKKANETLDKTPEMLSVLKEAGVVDAGGKGILSILEGFNNAILGIEIKEEIIKKTEELRIIKPDEEKVLKYQYCTEFIILSKVKDVLKLKSEVIKLGDSLVFVQDEDIVKVHVHTNEPGEAIGLALKYGELIDIKIDNMKRQHENKFVNAEKVKNKMFGFITVAMGEGIKILFEDMGVDYIISGGQTMNPSTEDIMAAIDQINADYIFLLPNNSNIVMAANQAKALSEKNIIVIPTKTIPQGISALVEFDEKKSFSENEKNMCEIIKNVKTLQFTFSVRDSKFNNKKIKKDDILGILDGEIEVVGKNLQIAVSKLVDIAMYDDCEIVSVYCGEEVKMKDAEKLVKKFEKKYPDVEFELYYGGQPLYYYIIALE